MVNMLWIARFAFIYLHSSLDTSSIIVNLR